MDFSLTQIFSNIWSIAMVVVFFGGSIFVHELGHFLAALWRGLKVDRFSIGFGPRLLGWTKNGIDYRISLFPLGGYVALPQLADMRGIEGEGSDIKQLPQITYTDKVIVASAGAVFNIIFAFIIATVLWQVKVPTAEQNTNSIIGHVSQTVETSDGIVAVSPAKKAGLQIGDRITKIDGYKIETFMDLQQYIAIGSKVADDGQRIAELEIDRNGENLNFTLNPIISKQTNRRLIGIQPSHTLIIHTVVPNSPASEVGLQTGDIITSVNGVKPYSVTHYRDLIKAASNNAVEIQIARSDESGSETSKTLNATPQTIKIDTDGNEIEAIGISIFTGKQSYIKVPPQELIVDTVIKTYSNLKALVSPKSDINLSDMSGPVGIARMIYQTSQIDFRLMLWVIVMINVGLAIFNMLPIPVLDGGHIAFATIAKIQNKPLPINFIASVQGSFMVILLGMICYITFFDASRWNKEAKDEQTYKERVNKQIEWVFEKPESLKSN
ncbi:MAG: site-2 protease family protein [Verrucomicrobiota bacterium]